MTEPASALGLRATFVAHRDEFVLDVDLRVAPGETVAVLGPNGAGKSTLLGVLAGLVPIDAGTVTLNGRVLENAANETFVEPDKRSVGVVFQDYLLFPHLSVLDNVTFGLRSRGVKRGEAQRRGTLWLERVGLASQAVLKPNQLSGGQAQRVALARALITEPTLLLLDEPLAALDAQLRVSTRRDLSNHLTAYEGVRLVVTHDPREAAALADRLVVLEEGRIVQQGTPAEISADPRSPYVADLARSIVTTAL